MMPFDPNYREPLFKNRRRTIVKGDFKDANIGDEFWNCRVDSIPDGAPYKSIIQKYIDNLYDHERSGHGLILYGDYGTGKTGAAVAVCVEAMMRGGRAWFLSSWEIEEVFRNTISWRERAQQCAKKMQFLILDDVGVSTKKNRETVDNVIAMLIRMRSNSRLPTIVTTNLNPDKLCGQYESIYRIFASKYKDVEVVGTDWVVPPKGF